MEENININKKVTVGKVRLISLTKKFINNTPKNILGVLFVFSLILIGSFVFTNKASAATDCTNTVVTGVPQIECEALIALYNNTGGASWTTKTNWNTATAVSTWYDIAVSGGHVISIYITGNHLVGTIPSQIGNLPYLTNLNLWNNTISGSIPTEIGNLTNLTSLNLVTNALSGSIPTSIGNLTKLTVLILYGNPNMSGSLPSEIGNLVLLQNLNLSGNFTAGPIPASWSALINLKTLVLASTHINGTIPTFISSNFTQLTTLDLSNNSLSGSIPAELGNLINLTSLSLPNNSLTGSIPAELGNLIHLTNLDIHNNQLTGSIPSLSGLTALATLNVYANQLTGQIPTGLSSTLRTVYFSSNKLSGPIPSNFASIPLTTFWILNNNFVFSDMETDFSSYCSGDRSGFSYNPQYNVDTIRTVSVQTGNILTITPVVSANTNDIYQWYKDGSIIPGATSRVFTKSALDSDTGVYSYRITNSVVTGLTLQSNNITVNISPNPPASNSIYYIVSGNTTWVRGSISDTKDIAQSYNWNNINNLEFDFGNTYIINNNTSNTISRYTAGTLVHSAGDDSTPIQTINTGYIMEGHGISTSAVTSTGHDKTNADIGSTWSNGGHQFILAEISGNVLTFYPIATGTPWIVYSVGSGSLIHVSGATHTGNITVTSVANAMKYPIIKNTAYQTLVNGATQTVDGNMGYADSIDFIEEFDLVDPSTIVRTNNPWVWNDGQVWMHVRNVYHATAGNTTVHSTYNIVRPMNIGFLGIIQSIPLITTSYDHLYLYVPKTKPIMGYDFKSTQLFDSTPASPMNFTTSFIDNANNPPDRQIEFLKKTAEDNYDIGFAFGYSPYGDTAANKRNCLSDTNGCLYIYTSKKVYPEMVSNTGVVNNVTYDAYAYRQFIDPKQYDIGKTAYWNNQNGRDLVYVDYHRSAVADVTALPSKFIGKSVRVVESENMQTPPTIIPGDGNLVLSTTDANTYGYAVLELTDTQSALPVVSPVAGLYNATQSVTLTATGSTSIRYSTTETPADCSSGILYSAETPILVSTSQTIYARACNSFGNSSTQSFAYVIDSEAPSTTIASPVAGTYTTTQSVSLTSAGSDSIRYSTIETPATCSAGTLYTTPISVSTSQTIYVRACDSLNNSSTTNFAYVISPIVVSHSSSGGSSPLAMAQFKSAQQALNPTPTPTVTPTPSVSFTTIVLSRILKLATPRIWGDDVLALQTLLNTKGYDSGTPDGNFGPKTQAAVIAFQKANGLVPDGSVGSNTLKYLNGNQTITTTTSPTIQPTVTRILKLSTPRMIGDDILALQTYLSTNGYDIGTPDGIFGSKTYSAVIAFQTANSLTPDGIVGPLTRGEMNK